MARKVVTARVGSIAAVAVLGVLLAVVLAVLLVFAAWPLARDFLAQRDLDAALALYTQRCASAGETIYRRVGAVDGLLWMKWRDDLSADAFTARSRLDDPYGHDCGLDDCVASLLRASYGDASDLEAASAHATGFRWVETVDPRAPTRWRYVAGIDVVHWRDAGEIAEARRSSGAEPGPAVYGYAVKREEIDTFGARYGLRWNDISTAEDRAHWIAGGSLEIVDLETGEILARRVGYMIDRLQGRHPEGTAPWLRALREACPPFAADEIAKRPRERHGTVARDFALRVLQ
jgi:hypothetical protein